MFCIVQGCLVSKVRRLCQDSVCLLQLVCGRFGAGLGGLGIQKLERKPLHFVAKHVPLLHHIFTSWCCSSKMPSLRNSHPVPIRTYFTDLVCIYFLQSDTATCRTRYSNPPASITLLLICQQNPDCQRGQENENYGISAEL